MTLVALFWHEPDEGYYDIIPDETFANEGNVPVLEHEILFPGGAPTPARCSVTVEGARAILDYRDKAFAEFNNAAEVYRGTLKISFADDSRKEISGVEWKGWSDSDFFPAPLRWQSRPFTSEMLTVGTVYTRNELRAVFGITDATLDTGVFRPKGTRSIWLFVTEEKTKDRTQYSDSLSGDLLHWEGQTAGRTDPQIIGHEAAGDELLVFYRRSKRQHPGAGFEFEGRFRYLNHQQGNPSRFALQRIERTSIPETAPFDPANLEDGRKMVLASVAQRQGQKGFRQKLLAAYGGCCAITGCNVGAVLEAAHIHPYLGPKTNDVTNGLLLRADLHTLFDLHLLTIDDAHRVSVSKRLKGTPYWDLNEVELRSTANASQRPSPKALEWHRTVEN